MSLQDPSSKALADKKTGFKFRGQDIVLSKVNGRPPDTSNHKAGYHTDAKRIEAVTLYAVFGNMTRVAELTEVPYSTIQSWRKQQWFADLLDEIREENNDTLDAKFTETIHKAIEVVGERMENGDSHVLKDGSVIKVPVKMRDAALVAAINIDKRQLLRGKPTSRVESVSSEQQLKNLAETFIQLAQKGRKPVTITDAEIVSCPENGDNVPEK